MRRFVCTVSISILVLTLAVSAPGQTRAPSSTNQQKTAEEFFLAGYALEKEHQYEQALEQYAAAIRIDPKHFGAHVNSGGCYLSLKKFESAVAEFKAAANLKPNDAYVQFNLGVACAQLRRRQDAMASFKEALRLEPKMGRAYSALAALYADGGDYEAGIKVLIEATQLVEDNAIFYFQLGELHLAAGALSSATEAFQRVIATRPGFVSARLRLGAAYERMARYSDAADVYRQSIEIEPGNAEAHV